MSKLTPPEGIGHPMELPTEHRFLYWVTPERQIGAYCEDCMLSYLDEGFHDLVVPDEVWARISPTGDEGGLLCPTCMTRRCATLGIQTKAVWESGPFCED